MDKKRALLTIGNNLRALMNQTGTSLVELARTSGISTGTVTKVCNGTSSVTVATLLTIAQGLDVSLDDLLQGVEPNKKAAGLIKPDDIIYHVGIMSIKNRRLTCVLDEHGNIVGNSSLERGVDLAETTGAVFNLIKEAILHALPISEEEKECFNLRQVRLNLVAQSYEFEDTRARFTNFIAKYVGEILILPDWQLTYLSAFPCQEGISLITDKGVSLSFLHEQRLKKLGGWKFPIYDLGGENWLGDETIRHTVEAKEGLTPMTELAQAVLTKFNGKIERITEFCFKGTKDPDIYCVFAEILLKRYLLNDPTAIEIFERGYQHVKRIVDQADRILGKTVNICMSGSLASLYKPFLPENRIIKAARDDDKVALLASLHDDYLAEHGIKS